MYSLIHPQVMKADPQPRHVAARSGRPDREHPPPRRLRAPAAKALGVLARRIDDEAARRAIA
jgi:hypothetical protein